MALFEIAYYILYTSYCTQYILDNSPRSSIQYSMQYATKANHTMRSHECMKDPPTWKRFARLDTRFGKHYTHLSQTFLMVTICLSNILQVLLCGYQIIAFLRKCVRLSVVIWHGELPFHSLHP
uniref:Uncharacterized protein n=1 Tax=Electrophorus electricus TaxID=8005 RepID=A0AAY5EI38_ELEEL